MAWSGQRFDDFRVDQVPGRQHNAYGQTNRSTCSSTATSRTMKLENLSVGSTANVIGVVIAKESPKSIYSRKNNGSERHLVSFAIRDSPSHFVNCTCWGKEQFIEETARMFTIGDVVILTNAQVQQKPTDGSDEKFRISTPVPFQLSLSENHSSMELYNGLDLGSFVALQYIPTKASSDYYTLEDVLANGESLNGEHINLLVAIRKVCAARDITTKTGKHTKRCEVLLFDESCSSFSLILWGEELVNFAQSWIPINTVLFAADVRMNFDSFKSSMVAVADSKTVFTLNPDTVDASCLSQFAQTQHFPDQDNNTVFMGQDDMPLDQIKEVATVEQVDTQEGLTSDYAVVIAVITQFDIDAENTDHFFRRKCSKCKRLVSKSTGYQCTNTDCAAGALSIFNMTGQVTAGEPELEFNLPISITDQTGTTQTRMTEQQIEALTGYNVDALIQLGVIQRTEIKWSILMERFKIYIKVVKNVKDPERSYIRILSCSKADIRDMI